MNAVKQEGSDHIDIDVKIEYLMDIKREEGYFDDLNEDDGGVGGDDVGGGEVVVKEEEVEEVVEEEVVVGVKRKAEEETKPRKTKKRWTGNSFTNPWTKEEEDALLKGIGKYGLDYERIKKEDDGKVLADRTLAALRQHLFTKFPENYTAASAATPWKGKVVWTSKEDAALKTGVEEHGNDWEKIKSNTDALKRRTPVALRHRYNKIPK